MPDPSEKIRFSVSIHERKALRLSNIDPADADGRFATTGYFADSQVDQAIPSDATVVETQEQGLRATIEADEAWERTRYLDGPAHAVVLKIVGALLDQLHDDETFERQALVKESFRSLSGIFLTLTFEIKEGEMWRAEAAARRAVFAQEAASLALRLPMLERIGRRIIALEEAQAAPGMLERNALELQRAELMVAEFRRRRDVYEREEAEEFGVIRCLFRFAGLKRLVCALETRERQLWVTDYESEVNFLRSFGEQSPDRAKQDREVTIVEKLAAAEKIQGKWRGVLARKRCLKQMAVHRADLISSEMTRLLEEYW